MIGLSVIPWLRDDMLNDNMCAHTYWMGMNSLGVIA